MNYRKKPVVIEAVKYDGKNTKEIWEFVDEGLVEHSIFPGFNDIYIDTLEGKMMAEVGDWIIKGVNGEFYPCKPDIFEQTYERVETDS